MDWAERIMAKIPDTMHLSSGDRATIKVLIQSEFGTLLQEARVAIRKHSLKDLEEAVEKFDDPALGVKGKWVKERASGFDGFRCQKCATWIYEHQWFHRWCDCDKKVEEK